MHETINFEKYKEIPFDINNNMEIIQLANLCNNKNNYRNYK